MSSLGGQADKLQLMAQCVPGCPALPSDVDCFERIVQFAGLRAMRWAGTGVNGELQPEEGEWCVAVHLQEGAVVAAARCGEQQWQQCEG